MCPNQGLGVVHDELKLKANRPQVNPAYEGGQGKGEAAWL